MNEINSIITSLNIMRLNIESMIEKLKKYSDSEFDVLNLISSAEYGKQRFFKEKNGIVYDREKNDYLVNSNDALERYLSEIEYEKS